MDLRKPLRLLSKQYGYFNRTRHEQKLPQHILQTLDKLIEAGSPPETISFVLGIDIEQVQRLP
jgi:hypothetical protein